MTDKVVGGPYSLCSTPQKLIGAAKGTNEGGHVMANQEHLDILKQGVETWNQWRLENGKVKIDLVGADLSEIHLRGANLQAAVLLGANLSKSDLRNADFRWADLHNANLSFALLQEANLSFANLSCANLHLANLHLALQPHLCYRD